MFVELDGVFGVVGSVDVFVCCVRVDFCEGTRTCQVDVNC